MLQNTLNGVKKMSEIDLKKLRFDNDLTQEELGNILGVTKQHIGRLEKGISKLSEEKKQLLIQKFGLQCNKVTNNVTLNNQDIIKIPYFEWLPEEMKNSKYPDVVARLHSIEDWGKADSLRIVAMNGDAMEAYWYKIQNKDVLLIDTSETKVNVDGRGVYFATSQNNTRFWVREMMEQLDGSIEFRAYPNSEIITKVYTKQQLKDVDFKVIGKVIKNVSLKLK